MPSLPSICSGLMVSTKARTLAISACRSAKVTSLSSYFGTSIFGEVHGDLYLAHQREHVREQARLQQGVGLDVLGAGVGFSFVQHIAEGVEHLLEDRDGSGVQGNSHDSLTVMAGLEPAAIIAMPGACLLFFQA